jgi:hypothetical protein
LSAERDFLEKGMAGDEGVLFPQNSKHFGFCEAFEQDTKKLLSFILSFQRR